jgi:hypothetical protein
MPERKLNTINFLRTILWVEAPVKRVKLRFLQPLPIAFKSF